MLHWGIGITLVLLFLFWREGVDLMERQDLRYGGLKYESLNNIANDYKN